MARHYSMAHRHRRTGRSHHKLTGRSFFESKQSLAAFLKDKDDAVRQAAADALNEAADEIKQQMLANMSAQGITDKTGRLRASVEYDYATAKRPRVLIKSEAVVDAPVLDKQGSINPGMKGRYTAGASFDQAPYGRFIEFSPRIRKPWFYTAWYDKMNSAKEKVIQAISKAWAKQ